MVRASPAVGARWADWTAAHPEWWSLVVSAAAWTMLLGRAGAAGAGPLCQAHPSRIGDLAEGLGVAWRSGVLGEMMRGWGLMVVAMVPVLAVPMIRHVAARSFADRRGRAAGLFLAGSVAVWLILGAAVSLLVVLLPTVRWAAAAGFLAAAWWQVSPAKRQALSRCHRTFALAASGWPADRDCLLFGARNGIACVASCWAMMVAAMFAGHGPLLTLCVQGVALAERRSRRPRVNASAVVLLGCGAFVLL